MQVFWECGGTLAAPAIASGVIHKVLAFVAPKIIGGARAPTPVGELGNVEMTQVGVHCAGSMQLLCVCLCYFMRCSRPLELPQGCSMHNRQWALANTVQYSAGLRNDVPCVCLTIACPVLRCIGAGCQSC